MEFPMFGTVRWSQNMFLWIRMMFAVEGSRLCQIGKSYGRSRGKLHEGPGIMGFCDSGNRNNRTRVHAQDQMGVHND